MSFEQEVAKVDVRPFIHGQSLDVRSEGIATVDPANGSTLATVPVCDGQIVADAVTSSKTAFAAWRNTKPPERAEILTSIAAALRRRQSEIARIESLDVGKPLREAERDVALSARYFEYYAGAADKIQGDSIPLGPGLVSYTTLEPVGVTAHIVPWNFPISQAARGLAPALAAGATAVLKPAEQTPLTALVLGRLMKEAGLPDGVCNIVCGPGAITGDSLVKHPDVAHVTFTGSVGTGKRVMQGAAEHIASVTLELGGKSPCVVLEDADLEKAADGVLRGIFNNCGQICSASARLVVDRRVADDLLGRLKAAATAKKLGRGIDNPDMGPIVSALQRDKVEMAVDAARSRGAKIVTGGKRANVPGLEQGYFYEPTILIVDDPNDEAAQEEIFGPVLTVQIVDGFDEAVAVADNSKYGLVGGIYTRDVSRALKFANALSAGQVFVNGFLGGGVETAFGGTRQSGIGREKGLEALRSYVHSKTVIITL